MPPLAPSSLQDSGGEIPPRFPEQQAGSPRCLSSGQSVGFCTEVQWVDVIGDSAEKARGHRGCWQLGAERVGVGHRLGPALSPGIALSRENQLVMPIWALCRDEGV